MSTTIDCFLLERCAPDENPDGRLWRRQDTGEIMVLHRRPDDPEFPPMAPAGAMWWAPGFERHASYCGLDGKSLVVRTPGGDWMVDSRASNCDSPCVHCGVQYKDHRTDTCSNPGTLGRDYTKGSYDDSRPHKCWCRHGEAPAITVDKIGVTCGAGGGSIQCGSYHGFLTGGKLIGA